MSIYYFENENGSFLSENGKRRFIRLSGNAAYEYMRTNRSKDMYFIQTVTKETDGEKVFVEVPKNAVPEVRREINHDNYLSRVKRRQRKKNYIYYPLQIGDGKAVFDKYGDDGHSVEDAVLHEIDLEILRRALKYLSEEELRIIRELYLSDKPIAERELSRRMNIPVTTLNYRKKRALNKLRRFF